MPLQTEKQRGQSARFCAYLEGVTRQLGQYEAQVNLGELQAFQASLNSRMDAFFQQNRTLHVAVLGQLKSGKSSFLNALLFAGAPVLPYAIIPKTAVLTQIEYSPQSELLVEYYQQEEWDAVERLAASPVVTASVRSAQEMIGMAVDAGTDIARYLAMGQQTIPLEHEDEIAAVLNQYVGENGAVTPAVKSVTLRLNQPVLQGVVVVDTPGLNDPVVSRAEKTRRNLEHCDVAFFLSRSGHLLDQTDLQLLTNQLPQKGLKQLVLIASMFDEALTDCIYDHVSLADAVADTKVQLRRHAMRALTQATATLRQKGYPNEILQVIEGCKRPLFVSALAQQMCEHAPEICCDKEQLVKNLLSVHHGITPAQLAEISGFAAVQQLFAQMVAEKEQTLAQKAEQLVLAMQMDLQEILLRLQQAALLAADETRDALQQNAQASEQLREQMVILSQRVQQVFDKESAAAQARVQEAIFTLRQIAKNEAIVTVHTDVKSRTIPYVVQDTVFYKPWTWNKSHTEYLLRNDSATYTTIEDVLLGARRLKEWTQTLWMQAMQGCATREQMQAELCGVQMAYNRLVDSVLDAPAIAAQIETCLRLPSVAALVLDDLPLATALQVQYPVRVYGQAEQAAFHKEAMIYQAEVLRYLTATLEAMLPRIAAAHQYALEYFNVQMFAADKVTLQNLERERSALHQKEQACGALCELLSQYLPHAVSV